MILNDIINISAISETVMVGGNRISYLSSNHGKGMNLSSTEFSVKSRFLLPRYDI